MSDFIAALNRDLANNKAETFARFEVDGDVFGRRMEGEIVSDSLGNIGLVTMTFEKDNQFAPAERAWISAPDVATAFDVAHMLGWKQVR